jgi:TRAP-type C4-dicarboxylate transport system permease small subunit
MSEKKRSSGRIEKFIMSWSIVGITAVMIFNVIARYFFNKSWTPTEEVCLTLVIVSTCVGASYAVRKGEHLFVSVIFDLPMIPVRFKRFLSIMISSVGCFTCTAIGWYGIQYVMSTYRMGRVTPSLGIPMYLIYIAFPAGFLVMAFHFFHGIRKNLRSATYFLGPEAERRED